MKWYAADNMPNRKLVVCVRDNRITIPATSDALASARRDGVMVFKGSKFNAVYLLGRRIYRGWQD